MALFSFGKKDKNPPEVTAPVVKAPSTPPKIQTPPETGSFPAVKPPQPSGLMPTGAKPVGMATTQPMAMPRTGTLGSKAPRLTPSQTARSTQRIVLPASSGSQTNSAKPMTLGAGSGRIHLPVGMILRCLPPEVLVDELSKFEENGSAAAEIGLPMQMILGQLPSGKVEITLEELVPHFPAGYLQPTESITSYLPRPINLPLMDVVMRIPPDLLALRPDQKDVDSSVINMADPFTEEILREQAESARRQAQPKIIDESQVPQEEFVPKDQASAEKSIAPPKRPTMEPAFAPRTVLSAGTPPPRPPVTPLPSPSSTGRLQSNPSTTLPTIPMPSLRPAASGKLSSLDRPTTVLPTRPVSAPSLEVATMPLPQAAAPVPPVPRHTGTIPAPPPPRHTTTLPVPNRTGTIPLPSQAQTGSVAAATPASKPAPPAQKPAAEVIVPAPASNPAQMPDANADDLQRLAALAMAQLGDSDSPSDTPSEKAASSEPQPTLPTPQVSATPDMPESRPSTPLTAPLPETAAESSDSTAPASSGRATAFIPQASPGVAFNLNTCSADDLVQNITGCSKELAESIVLYRDKIGSFKRLEDLLDVPGITKAAYVHLTGEQPPENRIPLTLNELLGFPGEQHITLKDVTERIACWPDVTGCILSQSSGLSLVGTVAEGVNREAIVAFAPRMFEAINKSFGEVSGRQTDALVIPTAGTSFHLFHNRDLYLIIMSRLPQMPERHVKVARFVLAALSTRTDF